MSLLNRGRDQRLGNTIPRQAYPRIFYEMGGIFPKIGHSPKYRKSLMQTRNVQSNQRAKILTILRIQTQE